MAKDGKGHEIEKSETVYFETIHQTLGGDVPIVTGPIHNIHRIFTDFFERFGQSTKFFMILINSY